MASGAKIKYAKLRLFKPSPSGRRSKPAEESSQENGENPNPPPSPIKIQQMEQEVINLVDSDEEPAPVEEPVVKRTRLDPLPASESSKPSLPKLPRKPPEGEAMISSFFKKSEDDFEPETTRQSQAHKTKTKVQRKAPTTRKPRAPRKPKDQSDIRKAFQKFRDNDELLNHLMLEHSVADRMDPEQLQLALAMSRSLVDQQGGGESQEEPKASASSSSLSSASSEERRLQGIRTTLEQYGFKCKNSYTDYDLNVIFGSTAAAAPKKARRTKHNRPTLLVKRSREELVTFLSQRAEQLLKDELHFKLKDTTDPNLHARTYGSDIFWMSSHPEPSTTCLTDYYVEGLVELTTVKADYLLKDWHKIPGRERTPERTPTVVLPEPDPEPVPEPPPCQEIVEDPEDSLLDMNNVSDEYRVRYNNEAPVHHHHRKCSPSPDLFASESGGEEDGAAAGGEKEHVEVEETPEEKKGDVEGEGEEVFLTAPEVAAEESKISRALCTSSENIFDDSDPMMDYEVYSSEEAKISPTGPADQHPREASPKPSQSTPPPAEHPPLATQQPNPDEDVAICLSSGDSNNSMEPRSTVLQKRPSAVAPDSEIPRKEQRLSRDESPFPAPDRELSFHSLAIRDRLSRVTLTDVETIQLEEEEEPVDRDEEVLEENGDGLQTSKTSSFSDGNDCLVISDDEVNYSIRQDCSAIYNVSPLVGEDNDAPLPENEQGDMMGLDHEEDPDSTNVYFNAENFEKQRNVVETPSKPPEGDVHSISSDEEIATAEESRKADNTMAFLDGLIAKFNLPVTSNPTNCDKPKGNASNLDDFIENYESPDFTDVTHGNIEQPVPSVPSTAIAVDNLDEEIEQVLLRAHQTCTQLPSKPPASSSSAVPLHRTKSAPVLVNRQNRSPPKKPMKTAFQGRFQALVEQSERAPEPLEVKIRLEPVSPRPDFPGMSSPLLHRELYKYGLKQLSRPKAVKILNHIYDQLHPFVELVERDEDEVRPMDVVEGEVAKKTSDSEKVIDREQLVCAVGEGSRLVERADGFVPEMDNEEYILPSKPRKKTFWCPVPLNIAFYNMVRANPALRQQILRYQPVDLDAIYAHLKEIGLRYESNDLIAFLDKRCITFRTAAKESQQQGSSGARRKKAAA